MRPKINYPIIYETTFCKELVKTHNELNSSSEYFNKLQTACDEIELIQKFLKQQRLEAKLDFFESTSQIRNGIDYFRRQRTDVLNDRQAGELYFKGMISYNQLKIHILRNSLYEKFFYFRYFQTNYFLN